ncbi:sensor histidine kinase [Oceanispirochaeta sp. M1]|nr:sensor histidine kinase [Oceanispirochaeta sp. M1]
MLQKRTIRLLLFLFSITLQCLSILQYLWKDIEVYSFNWFPQYITVVIISILLTILYYSIKARNYQFLSLLIRFVLLLVVFLPSGIYIGLKQFFLLSFLLDLTFFYPFPKNSIMSICSFMTIYMVSIISRFSAQDIPLPVFHDILYVFIFSFLAIFFFTFSKYNFDSYSHMVNRVSHLEKTIKKLTDANSGFQNYLQITEKKSTEDERNRIIREIHDSIGYTLTTVMMLSMSILESNELNIDNKIKKVLNNINSSAKSGLNDMRIVLRILKIKKEDKESDLSKLRKMVRAFEMATNIEVRLEYGNSPSNYSKEVSHFVFRLIQEGMVNSLRHGHATKIDVYLFIENKYLIISIWDNGKGFNELSLGIGLKGMEERLKKINGTFSISNNTTGVSLRIEIPMNKESLDE